MSHTSGSQNSKISIPGPKSRCRQDCPPPPTHRETVVSSGSWWQPASLGLWQLCSTLQGQHFQVPPSAFTALSLLYLVTSPFSSLLRGMHLIAFRAHLDTFGPSPHLKTPNFITRAKQSPYKVASIGSRDKDEGSFGGNFSSLSHSA